MVHGAADPVSDSNEANFGAALLRAAAGRDPSCLALGEGARGVPYSEMPHLTRELAQTIDACSQPSARVAVYGENSIEFLLALLAVLTTDKIAVPLSPTMGEVRLRQRFETIEAALVVTDFVSELPASLSTQRILRFQYRDFALQFDASPSGEKRTKTRSSGAGEAGDPALILFTSGTTGEPKGVVLEHRNLSSNALRLSRAFGFDSSYRDLVISPLTHSGALQRTLATLHSGGGVVLTQGALSIAGLLEQSTSARVGGFYTPPPLIRFLLDSPGDSVRTGLATCRSIEIGSASLTAEQLDHFCRLVPNARVFTHYGLTECSRATILDSRTNPDKLDTVGPPGLGVEVTIRDDKGDELPAGRPGQIALRGPQMSGGYWRNGQVQSSLQDGWFLTGDYGRLDPEGFLIFLGREDDKINASGFSFFPAEVERALGEVTGVAEYTIVGIPDPLERAGQVVCTLIVPEGANAEAQRSLKAKAQTMLPPHMRPRKIIAVPHLVRNASGKLDRAGTLRKFAAEFVG